MPHSAPHLQKERDPSAIPEGSFLEERGGLCGVQCGEAGSGGGGDRPWGQGGRSTGGWLPLSVLGRSWEEPRRRDNWRTSTKPPPPPVSPSTAVPGSQPGASCPALSLLSAGCPRLSSSAMSSPPRLLTVRRLFLCTSRLLPPSQLLKSHLHAHLRGLPGGASPPGRIEVNFPALAHSCA